MRSAWIRLTAGLARGHFATALVLVMGTILLVPSPAYAHTDLRSSEPKASARLKQTPELVRLVFSEAVAPEFVRLSLTKGDGGTPRRLETRVNGAVVVGSVPPGLADQPVRQPGRVQWRVEYRVVPADGHPIEGTFGFTTPNQRPLRSPTPSDPAPDVAAPTTADASPADGDPAPSGRSGAPVLGTLVIGALVASVGLGVASWLLRARRRGED